MRSDQLTDAVAQMRVHTRLAMEQYEAGVREYQTTTARAVLYELGFTAEQADDVIRYIAQRGFDYCLDPIIAHRGDHPSRPACIWGIDQLESRLRCIR